MVSPADIARTRRCVEHYRALGLCPLPSRMDIKGPAMPTYASHYGPTPVPEPEYENWSTTNAQIICGVRSPTPRKIAVVDCDGEKARDVFGLMCERHSYKPEGTWLCRTGSGGYHYYFSLPASAEACPSGMLWGIWDTWGADGRGRWLKHEEVRLLGDNALVIAPPSIHVETGERYSFVGPASPNRVPFPAEAPAWLLGMERLTKPRFGPLPTLPPPHPPRPLPPGPRRFFTRQEVLDAIGENKSLIAKQWGLVTTRDQPNPNGWINCYVPGREDPRSSTASGSFHARDGTLQDRKDETTISFFDLGVLLGRYATWQECRDALGEQYLGRIRRPEDEYRHAY